MNRVTEYGMWVIDGHPYTLEELQQKYPELAKSWEALKRAAEKIANGD